MNTPTTHDIEKVDEMVRDFCSVVPKTKSEVRRRIESLVAHTKEEVIREVLEMCEKAKEPKMEDLRGTYGAKKDWLKILEGVNYERSRLRQAITNLREMK